jgi:uncharacterized membrane protein YhhN
MGTIALVAFAVFALTDWVAVAQQCKSIEYVAKPAALVALLIWAASGSDASAWLVSALALSTLGDVYLMLPGDFFVAGLLAFLLAHVAYIADFEAGIPARLGWLVLVLVVSSPLILRIVRSVASSAVRGAVCAYITIISLMASSALASGDLVAAAGAVLFLASDALIAWTRFVGALSWGRIAIIVTYHAGQFLLVCALRT